MNKEDICKLLENKSFRKKVYETAIHRLKIYDSNFMCTAIETALNSLLKEIDHDFISFGILFNYNTNTILTFNNFPEFMFFKPDNLESYNTIPWFPFEFRDKRIEILEKCVKMCEIEK